MPKKKQQQQPIQRTKREPSKQPAAWEEQFLMRMSDEALFHGWLDIIERIWQQREKKEQQP